MLWCRSLVWSNLRGNTSTLQENLTWTQATVKNNPIYVGTLGDNKELFQVYTPLEMWNTITQNRQMEFRYEWRMDYGQVKTEEFKATLEPFSSVDYYKLKLSNYTQTVGTTTAGIFVNHINKYFSTYDSDHDIYSGNCSTSYTNTPFWYESCWGGSINGGGVGSGNGYYNGAYWVSSSQYWGDSTGGGAGNGWFFIR